MNQVSLMGTISKLTKLVTVLFLLLLLFVMLFPFLIVIINSIKTPAEYAANGPMALPHEIYFGSIIAFWQRVSFHEKLWNSLVISLSVAVFAVLISMLNAFALGIGKVKGRYFFLIFFIIANTLPHESLVYPLYYLTKGIGLYDTKTAVIIIFTAIQAAFGTFLLTNVFHSFPTSLVEAALVDGASKPKILFSIVAPISAPSLSVLFTFFFIWTWNEFFLPLILLISNSNQTVPIAISLTQGQHNMDVTTASASALLGMLPCLIFFIFFQRTLSRGITAGSIK
ncbi:carbohydrate ABC transporter permease [Spirochaeta cellobiosiphila]|uniref:carbohydrate ABC transporter permease n=1 Tax=Spirochaeta cellobiosiphila TaxID=504483 RepID=UPI0003FAE382|nr:carbohydrate ABC transporter permease [Spirochaeta cellobiosiphila]